jgi:molybdate transport system substrate-binding protein
MTTRITGISSMATRDVLNDLAGAYQLRSGITVKFQSVGGVVAAVRVEAGEPFDIVVLASNAIDKLVTTGHVVAGSTVELVHSGVGVAVRAGTPTPDISCENELKRVVQSARTIGYSSGPSGVGLRKLFERWGIADAVRNRIVQAPPGIPVGELVAKGEVELGFQQLSELIHLPGISVLGTMPPGCEIVTTFTAGVCTASIHPEAVRALLTFMCSPEVVNMKRRHGMEPAYSSELQGINQ